MSARWTGGAGGGTGSCARGVASRVVAPAVELRLPGVVGCARDTVAADPRDGALDPWSGQGVYPPGGGPDGPMVQNVSADGSQIALVLDLGAHHLDLMFSDPRNPPCFAAARAVEEQRITQWIQEAYDAHRGGK